MTITKSECGKDQLNLGLIDFRFLVFRSNGCIFVSHIFMYPARIVRRSFLQVRIFVVHEFNESMNDRSFFFFFVVVFFFLIFVCLFYFQKFD